MNDSGSHRDSNPNDGIYTACLDLGAMYKQHVRSHKDWNGLWKIYVFA